MMYYIDRPATWKADNKKLEEVQQYDVGAYSNVLIQDDKTRFRDERDLPREDSGELVSILLAETETQTQELRKVQAIKGNIFQTSKDSRSCQK